MCTNLLLILYKWRALRVHIKFCLHCNYDEKRPEFVFYLDEITTVKPEIKLTTLCSRVARDVHYTRASFEKRYATRAQTLVHLKFKVHSTRTKLHLHVADH